MARYIHAMDKDEVFEVIQSDDIIRLVGHDIYNRKKPNKQKEAKIKVQGCNAQVG